MPNFETPPQERPVEGAKVVVERLHGALESWRSKYLAVILAAASFSVTKHEATPTEERPVAADAAESGHEEIEDAEVVEPEELHVAFAELQELDPEASPERVRLIIETLPEGFMEDVASIGFTDTKYDVHERYGMELQRGNHGARATAAGGEHEAGTVITFWKGTKGVDSEQIWNGTFLHEVAHANDWQREGDMSDAERDAFKAKVVARVQAEDRYRSSYVETIFNEDPNAELETKAVEYWAEIVEAHLKGEVLPVADAAIVKERLAASDPSFDADKALERRMRVLDAMALEEKGALPQVEPALVGDREAWIDAHMKAEAPEFLIGQREGRHVLVSALREYGTDVPKKVAMMSLLSYYGGRDELLEARKDPGDWKRLREAERQMRWRSQDLDAILDKSSPEDLAMLEEIARIVDDRDLSLGTRAGALSPEEIRELFPGSLVSDENEWITMAVDWRWGPDYELLGADRIIRDFEDAEAGNERKE